MAAKVERWRQPMKNRNMAHAAVTSSGKSNFETRSEFIAAPCNASASLEV
jgi:hypothetical protein